MPLLVPVTAAAGTARILAVMVLLAAAAALVMMMVLHRRWRNNARRRCCRRWRFWHRVSIVGPRKPEILTKINRKIYINVRMYLWSSDSSRGRFFGCSTPVNGISGKFFLSLGGATIAFLPGDDAWCRCWSLWWRCFSSPDRSRWMWWCWLDDGRIFSTRSGFGFVVVGVGVGVGVVSATAEADMSGMKLFRRTGWAFDGVEPAKIQVSPQNSHTN